MSELFDHLDQLKRAEPRVALATLVNTRGTTPRKEGAKLLVGEGGRDLTAAQAQQLALARLVVADPAVAILDEATAEAGSLGARGLEEAAAAATAGRTTLIVAHRLTQAATADRVNPMCACNAACSPIPTSARSAISAR